MGKKQKQKQKLIKKKKKERRKEEFRRWSELPELVLYYVFCRLLSLADVLCFSSVCRSWRRSVSSSSSSACNIFTSTTSSFPPFIHFPVLTPPDLLYSQSSFHFFLSTPTCRLQETLTLGRRRWLLPEPPPETLTLPFLGYSNEHLIFYSLSSSPQRSLLLVNVFSGQLTRVPYPIHGTAARRFRVALLTTTLLIVASDSIVLYHRPATGSWHRLDGVVGTSSLALFQNKIFCVDPDSEKLIHITTDHTSTVTMTRLITETVLHHLPPLPDHVALCRHFGYRLVDCGGEQLLLLRFTRRVDTLHLPPPFWRTINIFRPDFGSSTWVEVDSLGDWCIFVDAVGSCAMACSQPARWGGRSNCVYLADPDPGRGRAPDAVPQPNGWLVVPLDGGHRQFIIYHDYRFRFDDSISRLTRWPSPLWVIPTKLHYINS